MEIKTYKISQLKHAEYNPRKISDKQFADLQKSLENFDIVEPAVVNTHKGRENIIVGGNQRVKVAKKMGIKECPEWAM